MFRKRILTFSGFIFLIILFIACGTNPAGGNSDTAFSLQKTQGPDNGETVDEAVALFSWQIQNSSQRNNRTTTDYYYKLDGTGDWVSTKYAQSFEWNMEKTGEHTFQLYGKRGSTMSSNTLTWNFVFTDSESNVPLVLFVSVPETTMQSNSFIFSWVGQSKISTVESYEICLNNGEWVRNEALTTYSWNAIPIQDNVFSVRATDAEGRVSPVASWKFTRTQ
jgi:hypothetical protein